MELFSLELSLELKKPPAMGFLHGFGLALVAQVSSEPPTALSPVLPDLSFFHLDTVTIFLFPAGSEKAGRGEREGGQACPTGSKAAIRRPALGLTGRAGEVAGPRDRQLCQSQGPSYCIFFFLRGCM